MNDDPMHYIGERDEPPFENDWGNVAADPMRDLGEAWRRDFERGLVATPLVFPEQTAILYRVPYWLVTGEPRPSWFRRPIWRARAVYWRWFA